jgi:alkylated DNA nucleotide flippase Atl1
MIEVQVEGLRELRRALAEFSDRRFGSAVAEGLNRTARAIADEWGGQLVTRIDRPTALTRRAAQLSARADVGRLVAEVRLRPDAPSGADAPAAYLQPLERGGDRLAKRFERALQASGAMPAGHKAVPGDAAQLDGYGNVSRGQIVQVLNQLGADLSVGYQRVISRDAARRQRAAQRRGRQYIAFPQRVGGLPAGIYERKGRGLAAVFFFVSRTQYGRRLALVEHGRKVAQRVLEREIAAAVAKRWASLQRRGGLS